MLKRTFFILIFLFIAALFSQAPAATASLIVHKTVANIVLGSNPDLIVIPGTYIYYTSSDNNDIFFYEGFWWRPLQGGWYRSDNYSGNWVVVDNRRVPYAITHMPPRWRDSRNDAVKVKWNDTKAHWKEWHKNKYWDKRGWKNEEPKKGNDNSQRGKNAKEKPGREDKKRDHRDN